MVRLFDEGRGKGDCTLVDAKGALNADKDGVPSNSQNQLVWNFWMEFWKESKEWFETDSAGNNGAINKYICLHARFDKHEEEAPCQTHQSVGTKVKGWCCWGK
jgi:hypothetical protein